MENVDTVEISTKQDNAQHTDRHAATVEKKTTSKMYTEAPQKADSRHREADPYLRCKERAIGAGRIPR